MCCFSFHLFRSSPLSFNSLSILFPWVFFFWQVFNLCSFEYLYFLFCPFYLNQWYLCYAPSFSESLLIFLHSFSLMLMVWFPLILSLASSVFCLVRYVIGILLGIVDFIIVLPDSCVHLISSNSDLCWHSFFDEASSPYLHLTTFSSCSLNMSITASLKYFFC